MKKVKLLILGFLAILGLGSYSFASYSTGGYTWSDGFYWSESKGLISIITGDIVYTIMDKNLGATEVYDGTINSFGSSVNNHSPCSQLGYLYQWGNYHNFDCSEAYTVGVSSSNYDGTTIYDWFSNPLNSNSFVGGSYSQYKNNWSNAWGAITDTFESIQNMCPAGFSIPTYSDYRSFLADVVGCQNANPGSSDCSIGATELFYYLKFPYFDASFGYHIQVFYAHSSDMFLINNLYIGLNYYRAEFGDIILSTDLLRPGGYDQGPLLPVRCFKNIPVLPDNTWVALTGTTEGLPDPLPDDSGGGDDNGSGSYGYVDGGLYDPSTVLLYNLVLCYMSSGTVGENCSTNNYQNLPNIFPSLDTGDVTRQLDPYGNYAGTLWFLNAREVFLALCADYSVTYPFCSQLDLYSGVLLAFVYENGKLSMHTVSESFGTYVDFNGSGHLGWTDCYGVLCDGGQIKTGGALIFYGSGGSSSNGTGIDVPPLRVVDGSYIGDSYYKRFFKDGLFFSCPYSQSAYHITIGNGFLSKIGLDKVFDFLLRPLNCFIDAYSYGGDSVVNLTDFSKKYWDGYLIAGDQFEPLYIILDIILSLVYFVVYRFIFSLFTHH